MERCEQSRRRQYGTMTVNISRVRSLLSGVSTNTATLLFLTGLAIAGGVVLVSAWPAQRAAHMSVAAALRSD
jgi:hypothetical protein